MIMFRLTKSFFGEEDLTLFSKKLWPELPGILLWAIEGWKRLRDHGRLTQPPAGQALVDEMKELSSPIDLFLRECCVVAPGRVITPQKLFDAWKEWCHRMNREAVGDQQGVGPGAPLGAP